MPFTLPKIIYGSSALGNLYEVIPEATKEAIVAEWMRYQKHPVIDSAGKYGAGLALEKIGQYLAKQGVSPDQVTISNKLGWKRAPLTGTEPTFEQGAWFGLEHDAVQRISYHGILECYEQGNELLGDYPATIVSVHDPDEYLASAGDEDDRAERYRDIREAYRALIELRDAGKVKAVGVGAKDWRVSKRIFEDGVALDWVMLANSLTVFDHPAEVLDFVGELHRVGIAVINSAVFNAGFLIGGKYFDYRVVTPTSDPELFPWRDRFHALCTRHDVTPSLVCCQFALSPPGVSSLALNTSKPDRVKDNIALVQDEVPAGFWNAMKEDGLLSPDYPYV
jgi:D-threo-aldose 1-dehydrogenase